MDLPRIVVLLPWVLAAAASCAGKTEGPSSDAGAAGTGGAVTAQGGASGEGGASGAGGVGGSAATGGASGVGGGAGAGQGGAAGWAGAGTGGSGPCGGFDACPGNIAAITCSDDGTTKLACAMGDTCPQTTSCKQYCASCTCHVAPPVSGNLLAGCDTCQDDSQCGPGLACMEDPMLQGSGAKACVMK
ncbi:MAG TPA: hypothetical protein PLI95_08515 [Polyangiaceae bacterium]|nr:hypothetical protein [Polyangiaceae bacterium]